MSINKADTISRLRAFGQNAPNFGALPSKAEYIKEGLVAGDDPPSRTKATSQEEGRCRSCSALDGSPFSEPDLPPHRLCCGGSRYVPRRTFASGYTLVDRVRFPEGALP